MRLKLFPDSMCDAAGCGTHWATKHAEGSSNTFRHREVKFCDPHDVEYRALESKTRGRIQAGPRNNNAGFPAA